MRELRQLTYVCECRPKHNVRVTPPNCMRTALVVSVLLVLLRTSDTSAQAFATLRDQASIDPRRQVSQDSLLAYTWRADEAPTFTRQGRGGPWPYIIIGAASGALMYPFVTTSDDPDDPLAGAVMGAGFGLATYYLTRLLASQSR